MGRLIFPVLLLVAGCGVLLKLGFWQVDRLGQKETRLAQIHASMSGDPVALPLDATEDSHEFIPVTVSGDLVGDPIYVLTAIAGQGPGLRVIQAFDTGEARILVDRGLIVAEARGNLAPTGPVTYLGNLHWPQETDKWTPAPDGDQWFARDVPAMAEALNTAPIMVVVSQRSDQDPQLTPKPVDTSSIPNDHLGYAITWFLLAAVWAVMSGYLIYQTVKQNRAKDA